MGYYFNHLTQLRVNWVVCGSGTKMSLKSLHKGNKFRQNKPVPNYLSRTNGNKYCNHYVRDGLCFPAKTAPAVIPMLNTATHRGAGRVKHDGRRVKTDVNKSHYITSGHLRM